MPEPSGAAALYLRGQPVPFSNEPMVGCADGVRFRIADPRRSVWDAASRTTVEMSADGSTWEAIAPLAVEPRAGRVLLPPLMPGLAVRCSGRFHPLALAVDAEGWSLHMNRAGGGGALLGGDSGHALAAARFSLRSAAVVDDYRAELGGPLLAFLWFNRRAGTRYVGEGRLAAHSLAQAVSDTHADLDVEIEPSTLAYLDA